MAHVCGVDAGDDAGGCAFHPVGVAVRALIQPAAEAFRPSRIHDGRITMTGALRAIQGDLAAALLRFFG